MPHEENVKGFLELQDPMTYSLISKRTPRLPSSIYNTKGKEMIMHVLEIRMKDKIGFQRSHAKEKTLILRRKTQLNEGECRMRTIVSRSTTRHRLLQK